MRASRSRVAEAVRERKPPSRAIPAPRLPLIRDCSSEERRSTAKIANARGVVLVVEEPWGAHFGFHPYRRIGGRLARGGRPGSAQDRWSLERFFGSATPRWPSSVGPAIDAVEAVVDDCVRRRDVPRM